MYYKILDVSLSLRFLYCIVAIIYDSVVKTIQFVLYFINYYFVVILFLKVCEYVLYHNNYFAHD